MIFIIIIYRYKIKSINLFNYYQLYYSAQAIIVSIYPFISFIYV